MRMSELLTVGLGAALLMKDRAEEALDQMLDRGRQGLDESRSLRDRAELRLDRGRARCEARMKDTVRRMARDMGLVTREDLDAAVRAKD